MKRIFAVLITVILLSAACGCDMFRTQSEENNYSKIINNFENNANIVPLYYSRLSEMEKVAYINILNAINDNMDSAEVPELDNDSLLRVTTAVSYDNPQFLWLGKAWTLTTYASSSTVEIPYTCPAQTRREMGDALNQKIDRILLGINTAMSDYDKELYLHDYLISNCQYSADSGSDGSLNAYTAYGALVEGRAVCEGYARAMQILLSRVGINNHLITGTATNQNGKKENHMWNVVSIDSQWYHLDATWDDPQSAETRNSVWHTYFNLSDELIMRDHSFSLETDCRSVRANYYEKKSLYFTSFDRSNFADDLADELYRASHTNSRFVEVRFANQFDFFAAKEALSEQNLILTAVNRVNNRHGTKLKTSTMYISYFDNQYVIGIKF